MAIPVTTRSGKGSPLTQTEMDTNLTNLARSATESDEGNTAYANQSETTARTITNKAVVPGRLEACLDDWYADNTTTSATNQVFPDGYRIQQGSSAGGLTVNVVYPTPFTVAPKPQVTLTSRNDFGGYISASSTTGFTFVQQSVGASFNWYAAGI